MYPDLSNASRTSTHVLILTKFLFFGVMTESLACGLWLFFASSFVVSIILISPNAGAPKQDPFNSQGSPCLAQDQHSLRNFSFVGKAIFAGCFCKEMQFAMRMCAAWKLVHDPALQISQIKVFKKITMVQTRSAGHDVKGSCTEYASNIINGLYGRDQLNYSTVQAASSSVDWGFCDDMQLKNNLGCNYTLIPVSGHNSSLANEVHYFVPSFTNASQHLRLGKFYQLDVEKCKETVVNVRVSAVSDPSTQPKTADCFFCFPIKMGTPRIQTTAIPTDPSGDNDQRKRSEGMLLSHNTFLSTVTFLTTVFALF